MRFAPFLSDDCPFVGQIIHDPGEDERSFTFHKTGIMSNQASRPTLISALASPVNDFCFTPDTTLQGEIELVCVKYMLNSKNNFFRALLLNAKIQDLLHLHTNLYFLSRLGG